jgi:hypothetical protein
MERQAQDADEGEGREALRRKELSEELIQSAGWCGDKKSARKNTTNLGTPHGSFPIITPASSSVKEFEARFLMKVLRPESSAAI